VIRSARMVEYNEVGNLRKEDLIALVHTL
jgi:hypothetical protein